MARREWISFRLVAPSKGPPVQLSLSEDEQRAIFEKAAGMPVGRYLRWILEAALGSDEDALDLAKARAEQLNIPLAAWARIVILEAIGRTNLTQDLERACKVAKG